MSATPPQNAVDNGYVHAAVAWCSVVLAKLGINGWSDAAAVFATIYTVLLIADLLRKWWTKPKQTN